jgi:DNA-binding response OmpR family regulator
MKTNTDSGAPAGSPPNGGFRIHRASTKAPVKSVKSTRKILLVDDDKIILKTTSAKLTEAGYEVLTAEDGGSAIRQARQLQPHLILLDLNFPPDVGHGGGIPWDGFLILSWLRRQVELQKLPVIVITGGDVEKYKDRWGEAGVRDIFLKPIDHEALLAAIQSSLDGEVAEQEPTQVAPAIQPPPTAPANQTPPTARGRQPLEMAPASRHPGKAPAIKPPATAPSVQSSPKPPAIELPANAPSARPPAEPSLVVEPEPSAHRKILFIDDTSDWRYLGAAYLGERGYEVATSEDPISAMLQVSQFRPNLIVLDLNLGGQSAVTLLKLLSKRYPEVRVLIYTGMDLDRSEVSELLEQGAWNWLRKGSLQELGAAVEKTLNGPKATVPQSAPEPVEKETPRASLAGTKSATHATAERTEQPPECASGSQSLDSLRKEELPSAVEKETSEASLASTESATHAMAQETEQAPECASDLPTLDSLRTETTEELLSAVENAAMSVTREQTVAALEPGGSVPDEVIDSAAESILIVEDDAEFAGTLHSFLESQSFRVSEVTSGKEAVNLISAADVDLILFDLTLPGMPVDQFYGAVKAAKPHLCPRIIFMTSDDSHPTDDSFVRRLKGISLWKPFPMDWLLEAVQTIRAKTPQDRLAAK